MSFLDNSILQRKSALAFKSESLAPEIVDKLFEAARWAPSSFNDQPWKFFYAHRSNPNEFEKLLSLLIVGNREWAQNASVIVISTARTILSFNGKENKYAQHDTGLATANILICAQQLGLVTHVMGGFDKEKAAEVLKLTGNEVAVAAIAIGFAGDEALLSDSNRKRVTSPRRRKSINEVAVEV